MSLPACILTRVELGTDFSEDEVNDWVNNTYIPARVQLPAFRNCIRRKAIDDKKPTWISAYDVASYEDTKKPPYTTLDEKICASTNNFSIIMRLASMLVKFTACFQYNECEEIVRPKICLLPWVKNRP